MKKNIISMIALIFTANVFAVDIVNPNYNFRALSGNRILFGTGMAEWECRHVVFYNNGTQHTIHYGFATADYGYCPGYESSEYKNAYRALFGLQVSLSEHNPNSQGCMDDPESLGHGF